MKSVKLCVPIHFSKLRPIKYFYWSLWKVYIVRFLKIQSTAVSKVNKNTKYNYSILHYLYWSCFVLNTCVPFCINICGRYSTLYTSFEVLCHFIFMYWKCGTSIYILKLWYFVYMVWKCVTLYMAWKFGTIYIYWSCVHVLRMWHLEKTERKNCLHYWLLTITWESLKQVFDYIFDHSIYYFSVCQLSGCQIFSVCEWHLMQYIKKKKQWYIYIYDWFLF